MMTSDRLLITNIGDLITLEPLAQERRISGIDVRDLGRKHQAWLAIEGGKVLSSGEGEPPSLFMDWHKIDAEGQLILPGLVDAHTHPIFGGNRSEEFARRIDGETYQTIAAAGGGIRYTVRQTRSASDEYLEQFCADRLARFLALGVTTLEAKSGYGLTVEDELRLLRILTKVADSTPQTVVRTCLALHAVMPEYKSTEEYIGVIINDLLPEVRRQGLAEYVDAFVENGYFSVMQTAPYIQAAKDLGFKIRIHADEFADAGAALAAAEWGAHSADHVEYASDAAISAMAKSRTVAILLPGTSLYTAIPYAKAARFRNAGCGIALATDYNPGSCQVENLNFIATLGALHCGLRMAETVAAVTYVPAFSLGLGAVKGALAKGFDGDFAIFPMRRLEEWLADLGQRPPMQVYIRGLRVAGSAN